MVARAVHDVGPILGSKSLIQPRLGTCRRRNRAALSEAVAGCHAYAEGFPRDNAGQWLSRGKQDRSLA